MAEYMRWQLRKVTASENTTTVKGYNFNNDFGTTGMNKIIKLESVEQGKNTIKIRIPRTPTFEE